MSTPNPPALPSRADIDRANLAIQVSAQKHLAHQLQRYVAEAELSENMDDRHKMMDRLIKLAGSEPSKKDTVGAGLVKLDVSIGISGGSFNVQAKTEMPPDTEPKPDADVVDVEARDPDEPQAKAPAPFVPEPRVWDFSEMDALVGR